MIQPSNESKIKFLQNVCRRAGKEIKELKWQMHLMDCKLKSCEQWRSQTIKRMTDEKSNT